MKNHKAYHLLFFIYIITLCTTSYTKAQDWLTNEECTSIMVGRLASTDGSVITSHTCDGVSHTWVTYEKAADHKKGATTKIYKGTRWTKFKGDTTGVKCVGEIPQARHTYAYLNTGYPSLNEKQVAIGETTFTGPDTLKNPDGMFMIEELARVALERCDNARDAVKLMGELAEEYGYGDSGECLTVADKNEVWVFEILGCGKKNKGAVWAAQRVPDDHICISANIARIGKIDRSDSKNFLCSDNLEQVAREHGLWDGKEEFKFYKAFHGSYGNGKNFDLRDFYVFSQLAPSLGLSYKMDELPFSVKPDKKVDVRTVMELFRNTYEGTPYDMTQNWKLELTAKDGSKSKKISPMANPWLTADTRNTLNTIAPGTVEFTRTLAVCWCSYSTVLQLRNWLPDAVGGICWYAVDNPAESPRIPLFAGGKSLPSAFDFCGQKQYKEDCILWQFRRPNRLATVAWQKSRSRVEKEIAIIEKLAFETVESLTAQSTSEELDAATTKIYEQAAKAWKQMETDFWMAYGRGF